MPFSASATTFCTSDSRLTSQATASALALSAAAVAGPPPPCTYADDWADGSAVAGQQFEYGFDWIGNRVSTKAGGDHTGNPAALRSATYSANTLNQYTSRTVPNKIDLLGMADLGATVYVNSDHSGIHRKGQYFRKEQSVLITPGAHFGIGKYLRIGFGYDGEKTEAGLARLDQPLKQLKAGARKSGATA